MADTSRAAALTDAMLAAAAGSRLVWPGSPAEARAFGDGLVTLAKEFRALRVGQAGFATSEFQGKCFTRAMMCGIAGLPSISRGLLPGCLDDLTVGDLARWTPDRSQHLATVAGMGADAAQTAFGVPALTLSMWACLLGMLPPVARRTLTEAPDATLLAAIWQLESTEAGSFATPGLTAVANYVATQATG